MKYSVSVIALAGVSNAIPLAQFSIPSFGGFSLPSFPKPTGGLGGGFSIPSLPTNGAGGGFSLPSIGLPGATGLPGTNNNALISATPTATGAAQATQTGSTGGSVGADCTAQGTNGGSTENGVADKNCCTDLTVVFARGTGELGNVGTIAGPPMFESLRNKLGADRVTVQGVDYPASAAGNANLGADGGPAMAESVKAALSQCPDTKVIISGYSQGGMVVHNAFSQGLSASNVAGAVLFGDPLKSQAVGDLATDKVKQFCGTSDTICGSGDNPSGGHLSYGSVADEAADFAISAAGLA